MGLEERNSPEITLGAGKNDEAGLSLLHVSDHSVFTKHAELLHSQDNNLVTGLQNAGAVYAEILPEIPAAVARQIKSDLLDNTGSTVKKLAESAALGLGTAVLLARSPILAKAWLAGAGIGTTAFMMKDLVQFTGTALATKSPIEQSQLAASGLNSIGKLGANLIETSPAFFAAGEGGVLLSKRVAALDAISLSVRNNVELAARRHVPEGFHYLSFDAKSAGNIGTAHEFDLLGASQEWLNKTPWRGMEEGRFFKIASADSLKASARIPGSADRVLMGRSSQQIFHTHESEILPSSGDFNSVRGTGVIGVPRDGIVSFYEGTGKQAQELLGLLKAGKTQEAGQVAESLHARTFRAVVVDPGKELSLGVDMKWNSSQNRLEPSSVRTLDFADTVKNLSKWNGQLNIAALQSSSEALLKPGMTDLLRRLLPTSEI